MAPKSTYNRSQFQSCSQENEKNNDFAIHKLISSLKEDTNTYILKSALNLGAQHGSCNLVAKSFSGATLKTDNNISAEDMPLIYYLQQQKIIPEFATRDEVVEALAEYVDALVVCSTASACR